MYLLNNITCISILFIILISLSHYFVESGHEVLYGTQLSYDDIKPNELAIIQYDNRPFNDYWNTSMYLNKGYCEKYGHKYYRITSKIDCMYATFTLSSAWCKVRAILEANEHVDSSIKAFIHLDSDGKVFNSI